MLKEYIMPFVKECESTFLTTMNIKITAGRPYVTEIRLINQGDISTIIEFSGDVTGATALSMDKSSALKLADMLIGSPHDEVNNEVLEVISELTNIFAGQAKKHFEKIAALFISLPVVVVDGKFSKPFYSESRYIAIPFSFMEDFEFILTIYISNEDSGGGGGGGRRLARHSRDTVDA
ncbi:MAG: chemotaxis protein CheX [Treponema sp.]|jgi:chemotaxis protein CheX|nr:chemotaxis protein CheX [Treponema sp.]